jgi:hypothetical protein
MLQIFAGPLAAHTKKEETMSDAPVVPGLPELPELPELPA